MSGFHGYFEGAGEGRTVIDTTLGNPNDTTAAALSLTPDPNDPSKDVEPWPFLFGFSGGHVNVSAMSFNISTSLRP